MEPATMQGLGALASGAGALLSGFGGGGDRPDPTTSLAWWMNREDQERFAKHGIRWRVEDAKAAGLHPLYALGGAGAAYSPPAISVSADEPRSIRQGQALERMGQSLGRAATAAGTPQEREMHQAQLEVLRSQVARNYAEQAMFDSQASRNYQEGLYSRPIPMPGIRMPAAVAPADQYRPELTGRVTVKPDEAVSSRADDRSVTAATHAGLREYQISPYGLKIRLPYSEEGPSEALENIPFWAWPMMVQHNREYYGPDWGMRFLREFVFGKAPKYRQAPSVRLEPRFDNPVVRKYLPNRR